MYPRIIPEVYELSTNDGQFLVNAHPTTLQMAQYMTKKVQAGVKIQDIIFRVRPIIVPNASEVLEAILRNSLVS